MFQSRFSTRAIRAGLTRMPGSLLCIMLKAVLDCRSSLRIPSPPCCLRSPVPQRVLLALRTSWRRSPSTAFPFPRRTPAPYPLSLERSRGQHSTSSTRVSALSLTGRDGHLFINGIPTVYWMNSLYMPLCTLQGYYIIFTVNAFDHLPRPRRHAMAWGVGLYTTGWVTDHANGIYVNGIHQNYFTAGVVILSGATWMGRCVIRDDVFPHWSRPKRYVASLGVGMYVLGFTTVGSSPWASDNIWRPLGRGIGIWLECTLVLDDE
ncbi:hypothetical protein PENSPDRAFT_414176 [Peniophora sp. CONT]|nr:hypothetical protein PENSPDRAFT_414176 [Peniophora sp. CONT]